MIECVWLSLVALCPVRLISYGGVGGTSSEQPLNREWYYENHARQILCCP